MQSTVLITGGSGFLGKALAHIFSPDYKVVLASRNNKNNYYASRLTSCESIPLDICSIESIRDAFKIIRPDIVIHAAATKFVDLSEKFPNETIDVNVLGSQNIARVCTEYCVKLVVGISTDKAAPPCRNIYALSKALMERTFCAADTPRSTRFICVRYGNVAWSTGSVLPAWKLMAENSRKIVSCGSNMYRYMFSVLDAAQVVMDAVQNQERLYGLVIAKDMKSLQIRRLLDLVSSCVDVEVEYVPPRKGERLTEYLVGPEELDMSQKLSLNGRSYYSIDFKSHGLNHIKEPLSAATAESLTDVEILRLINNMEPLEC